MGLQIKDIVPKWEISLKDLQGKTLAVDAFNTLYQFLTTIRQPDGAPLTDKNGNITSHLSGLFYRTTHLMKLGIKLIFVFDGIPPEQKLRTHQYRKAAKDSAKIKYHEALGRGEEEEAGKYAGRFATLNSQMIEEAKELLDALGIPHVQAPSEGEAQAAFMAKQGDAWAAASQDYDSLLFGAPRLIQNLTIARKRRTPSGLFVPIQPELIEFHRLIEILGINLDQLICLGILCGTDYNPKGIYGLGPKKSLTLVKQYKTPNAIFAAVEKQLKEKGEEMPFDWKEVFDLFKKPQVTKDYKIKFKEIDEKALRNILVKKHDFSEERMNSALKKISEIKEDQKQKNLKKWF